MPRIPLNPKSHDLLVKFAMAALLLVIVGNYVLSAMSLPVTPDLIKLQDSLLFLVTGLIINPGAEAEAPTGELEPPKAGTSMPIGAV